MRDIRELIRDVAAECGKPEAAETFTKVIVEDNWLDSVGALKELRKEDWHNLKLPLKFLACLRKELERAGPPRDLPPPAFEAGPEVSVHTVVKEAMPGQKDTIPNMEYIERGRPTLLDDWVNIDLHGVSEIIAANRTKSLDSFTLLRRILQNAINNPNDPIKRKIRLSNKAVSRDICAVDGALQFLIGCGFALVREQTMAPCPDWTGGPPPSDCCIILVKLYRERIDLALRIINQKLAIAQLPVSTNFNPYKSSLVSQGNNLFKQANHEEYSPEILKDNIRAELRKRELGGGNEPVSLNPRYYPAGYVKKIVYEPNELVEESSSSLVLSAESLANLKEILSGNVKFRSTLRNQLVAVKKIPIYPKTCLRIIAPDRSYVEIDLKPSVTINDVYGTMWDRLLAEEFKATKSRFWLQEGPPNPILDETKSLFALGMVPTGQVRLGSELGNKYKGPWFKTTWG
ncbi:PUB domain protein [Gregarina niphandrodes]|uniref:PUB domain protein n=1 Tax=Gregarina niphandrodes TaxID=110365 RepID=A0A023AYB1_GRENI|nr:PUB domain protein [Gregarina niphandrodes]EZG43418.1 PUB domain protein [Gregarina niphandrodes]|eukprot:XP_011133359.1 PUB domain protein [Gregarina niphandrodes]